MAENSDFGPQTAEIEGEIDQLASEEDQSDDEYFDCHQISEDRGSDLTSLKKSDITVSINSSDVEYSVQAGNFADHDGLRAEKSSSVLDPNLSTQDFHNSSGESKSSESSTAQSAYVVRYQEEIKGCPEYTVLEMVDNIVDDDVAKLVQKFRVENYCATKSDASVDLMVSKCKMLYERDYHCEVVDNSNGVLCEHYPVRLIVPVAKKAGCESTDRSESVHFDPITYTEDTKKSLACRLRKRFVTPVIMFDKKFICRAGTITVRKTAAFETALQSPNPQAEKVDDWPIMRTVRYFARAVMNASSWGFQAAAQIFTPGSMKELREIDAKIMRDLKVQYICDLMIEDRKFFTFVSLCSSEKINPDIYRGFNIEQMPYPGCEFFSEYHGANREPEGLMFNWETANTILKLTENSSEIFPDIEWENYKKWDLVDLTKNYMKILLLYLAKDKGGLLVHCVSGWDRTPLFISMLRVSLWADGVIHKSLNYRDMAYLTLAYDWYLFGHKLRSRLEKDEEIMHFCFKFLQYIVDDEFSLTRIFQQLPIEQRQNGTIPDFKPGVRTDRIMHLSTYVLKYLRFYF